MLGVPLGCDEFLAGFVDKKLLGRLQNTVDKLVYSTCDLWKDQAIKFDQMIRKAIVGILGFPMDDVTFMQVSLTPKLGPRPSPSHRARGYGLPCKLDRIAEDCS